MGIGGDGEVGMAYVWGVIVFVVAGFSGSIYVFISLFVERAFGVLDLVSFVMFLV